MGLRTLKLLPAQTLMNRWSHRKHLDLDQDQDLDLDPLKLRAAVLSALIGLTSTAEEEEEGGEEEEREEVFAMSTQTAAETRTRTRTRTLTRTGLTFLVDPPPPDQDQGDDVTHNHQGREHGSRGAGRHWACSKVERPGQGGQGKLWGGGGCQGSGVWCHPGLYNQIQSQVLPEFMSSEVRAALPPPSAVAQSSPRSDYQLLFLTKPSSSSSSPLRHEASVKRNVSELQLISAC